MVSVSNLTVSFGGFTLLDGINFHIGEKDKIGLVGKNGAGKSTLLKILAGISVPTSGAVLKPAGLKVGYLPQHLERSGDRSVLDEAMTAFSFIQDLHDEADRLLAQISERDDYESKEYMAIVDRLNETNDRLNLFSGENPVASCERTLVGLGFRREDLGRSTSTFSQGWNMRIELAKILLSKPDLMLLDEPTNHLDIESIEWLEAYLRNYGGSLILISHDRRFLDSVTARTVEIMLGKIHDYKVPYSRYVELRKERIEQQKAAYENQQRMIEKTEDFIERFRYKPTKSNQVQSRIKQLDKLERIEVDEEDLSVLTVRFPSAPRSGQVIFRAEGVTAAYGSKVVFSGADMVVERGDKVVFVGRNGEGKTTMVRLIMKELYPAAGKAETGHNVSIGYFAQNQEDVLDRNDTVFGTLDRIAVGDVRTRLRDILAAFLFRGEDIDKKVSVLSGGERARLAMAKLMLNPYNVLVLDEPTNHMDIRSKDVLKQALKAYDGTVIMVSHDRDFLDGLADKVYEFRNGRVREHLGGISDFLYRIRMENLKEIERSAKPAPEIQETVAVKSEGKVSFEQQKQQEKERRRQQNRIKQCENRIAELEEAMKSIEERIASGTSPEEMTRLSGEYSELKSELDIRMEEWMEISAE